MSDFTVLFQDRAFSYSGAVLPNNIRWAMLRMSHKAIGGPDQALLTAQDDYERLLPLLDILRFAIQVEGDGNPIWWGYVHEIVISYENYKIKATLDLVANRIKTEYLFFDFHGEQNVSKTTGWIEDAQSISEYGVIERKFKVDMEFSEEAALNWTQVLLGQIKDSNQTISLSSQKQKKAKVELLCRGWWKSLDFQHYKITSSYLSHTPEEEGSKRVLSLGHAPQTSWARFYDLTDADIVEAAAGTFFNYLPNQTVFIEGSSEIDNNGPKTIVKVISDDRIEVREDLDTVDDTWPLPARVITFTPDSYDAIAQRFTIDRRWNLHKIGVRLRRAGNPTDEVKLGVYSGTTAPETLLFSGIASDIYDGFTWVDLLGGNLELFQGTYWLVVERAGDAARDYFALEVDKANDGSLLGMKDSAWQAVSGKMIFQVLFSLRVTALIRNAINQSGQFIQGLTSPVSDIYSYLVDQEELAKKIIEDFLNVGSSRRLIAWINKHRILQIYDEPLDDKQYKLSPDGKIRQLGRIIDDHSFMPGQWLGLSDSPHSVFIEKTEWSKSGGLKLIARNTEDPWEVLGGSKTN